MTDAGRVESYFRAAFSKLTDDQGRPIDIGLALPTLVKIVSGAHNEFAEQV
jgi:hypothetical protein